MMDFYKYLLLVLGMLVLLYVLEMPTLSEA